jgi:hypothetical protein
MCGFWYWTTSSGSLLHAIAFLFLCICCTVVGCPAFLFLCHTYVLVYIVVLATWRIAILHSSYIIFMFGVDDGLGSREQGRPMLPEAERLVNMNACTCYVSIKKTGNFFYLIGFGIKMNRRIPRGAWLYVFGEPDCTSPSLV